MTLSSQSCCIRDGCGAPFNPSEPETRDASTLRAFWYRYCPKHRLLPAGCAHVTAQPSKPAVPVHTHYIAMSGSHGCLPDSCNAYETYQDAVDSLAELFELGRTRKARLFADRYLRLDSWEGQYCEITICQCSKPWEHCDAGEDPRDWPDYERLLWWPSSSGQIEFQMTREQAESVSHQGACDADVAELVKVPAIAEQLAKLDAGTVRACLKEYGAWDADELSDHDANLRRLVWVAGCDIREGNN